MMDRMSDETLEGLATGVRPPEVKDRKAELKAADKIYRNDSGIVALPIEMLLGALVNAGRKVKNGKDKISTAKTTTLFDFLTITSFDLPLTASKKKEKQKDKELQDPRWNASDPDWVVDKRKGIGYQAQTPTAVCIIRPKFPEWEFDVEGEYNEKIVNGDTMRNLVRTALSSEGLGAFRPNKRGPFGRSAYVSWMELVGGEWKEFYVAEDLQVMDEDEDESDDEEAAEGLKEVGDNSNHKAEKPERELVGAGER